MKITKENSEKYEDQDKEQEQLAPEQEEVSPPMPEPKKTVSRAKPKKTTPAGTDDPEPEMSKQFGDLTPAYVLWAKRNLSEDEFNARYETRMHVVIDILEECGIEQG